MGRLKPASSRIPSHMAGLAALKSRQWHGDLGAILRRPLVKEHRRVAQCVHTTLLQPTLHPPFRAVSRDKAVSRDTAVSRDNAVSRDRAVSRDSAVIGIKLKK